MIIVLENADFSAKNIGTVFIPRELNEFTLNAIALSGNSGMTTLQKQMLDIFFENIGAFGTKSNIWSKLDHVILPFICSDITKATADYKTSAIKTIPASGYFALSAAGGIKATQAATSSQAIAIDDSYDFDCEKTVLLLNTESFIKPISSAKVWENGLFLSSYPTSAQVANSYRTYGFGRGYSTTEPSYFNKVFAITRIANNVYTGDDMLEHALSGLASEYGISANILTVSGNKVSAYINSTYVEMSVSKDYSAYEGSATALYLSSQANGSYPSTNAAACGAAMIGSVLTKTEMETLKREVETLYGAFHA